MALLSNMAMRFGNDPLRRRGTMAMPTGETAVPMGGAMQNVGAQPTGATATNTPAAPIGGAMQNVGATATGYTGVPNPAGTNFNGSNSAFKNFNFTNPTNPFQTNFNYLTKNNGIDSALSWAFGQGGDARQQLQGAMHPENMNDWNNLVNQYSPGGGSPLGGQGNYEGTMWKYGGMDAYEKAKAAAGGKLKLSDFRRTAPQINLPGYSGTDAASGGTGQPGTSGPPPGTPVISDPVASGDTSSGLPGTGSTDYSTPLTSDAIKAFMDPSYEWRLQQGLDAVQNSAASRGGLQSGQALKDVTDYAQGAASQEYGNAYNRAAADRNFRYGVDTGDRDFNYRVGSDDWTRNYTALRDLAQMGLTGTGGSGQLASLLASLTSGNTIGAGNAQAGGTIGGSNAINSTISQILNQILGNRMISSIQGG